jgi:hypothetical protein
LAVLLESILFDKISIIKLNRYTKSIKYLLFHVLLPLTAGVCIYLFCRPNTSIAEKIVGWHFKDYNLSNIGILNYLVGSLPDFLWCYALLSAQTFIWGSTAEIPKLLLYVLYFIIPFTELLQILHIFSGTGDMVDIIAYISAMVTHHFLTKPKKTIIHEKN